MSVLRTVARPLLACPFVLAGIDAFARPAGHRERAQTFAPLAKKAGMEFDETTADLATRGLGVGFALAGDSGPGGDARAAVQRAAARLPG